MPMVHSVRLGFATNSSSSHSLLLLRPGERMKNEGVAGREFGWEPFVASSRHSRAAYVALHIKDALRRLVNEETAILVVESLTGIDTSRGYIDHQSVYDLPLSRDGQGLDMAFLEEFQEFMAQERLVILGGHDNTNRPRSPRQRHRQGKILHLGMPRDIHESPYITRKDSRGYWTMFNLGTGTKVRFSWDGRDVSADRADAPELVDLKITSFCPHACPWCYQDSGTGGRHALEENLDRILWALSDLGVFEVAIGGGEPTCHPRFWEILRQIRSMHMVPNFSTRSLDWLHVPEKAEIVRDLCGGFAVSVTKHEEVEHAVAMCRETRMPLGKLSIQYAIGTGYLQAENIMRCCREHDIRCTLLGYKAVGRGQEWKPQVDDWISPFRSMMKDQERYPRVGIDTVLAKASMKRLKKLGIARESYEVEDGRFSMYVDAVENSMGPSSYSERSIPLPDLGGPGITSRFMKHAFSAW